MQYQLLGLLLTIFLHRFHYLDPCNLLAVLTFPVKKLSIGVNMPRNLHDIFLAATLLSNGVKMLLVTENNDDFAEIEGLKTVSLGKWGKGYSFKDQPFSA